MRSRDYGTPWPPWLEQNQTWLQGLKLRQISMNPTDLHFFTLEDGFFILPLGGRRKWMHRHLLLAVDEESHHLGYHRRRRPHQRRILHGRIKGGISDGFAGARTFAIGGRPLAA